MNQPISEFVIADLAMIHLGSYAEKDYNFAMAVIAAQAASKQVLENFDDLNKSQAAQTVEPVAWMDNDGNISDNNHYKTFNIPLYTTPPATAALLRAQAKEIEALNARIEVDFKRWQEAIANYDFERSLNEKLMDGSAKLSAEIEALRRDAVRLDWLECNAVITYGYEATVRVAFPLSELGRTVVTLRHTVDAAMSKEEK